MIKKKLLYKLISFLVVLSLISSMLFYSSTVFGDLKKSYNIVLANNEEGYENIKNEICINLYSKLYKTMKFDSKYPSDFAGAYIDENDVLNICYTTQPDEYEQIFSKSVVDRCIEKVVYDILSAKNSEKKFILDSVLEECVESYISKISDSKEDLIDEFINYEEKKFSYEYLLNVQDVLGDEMLKFSISKTEVIESTNSVNIYCGDEKRQGEILKYLKSKIDNFDSDSVIFYLSNEKSIPTAIYSAPSGTRTYSGSSSGTIGFHAFYQGRIGVVTNSHVAPLSTLMSNYDGRYMGTPSVSLIHGNTGSDFAFIAFPNPTSQWDFSYEILPDSNDGVEIDRVAYSFELISGANTVKYGVTTGYTTGNIIAVYAQITTSYGGGIGDVVMKDVISYSNATMLGDSGGPIGLQTEDGKFRLAGINFAKAPDSPNGYATKYKYLYAFTIVAYTKQHDGGKYK